jgi:hypothetical protein
MLHFGSVQPASASTPQHFCVAFLTVVPHVQSPPRVPILQLTAKALQPASEVGIGSVVVLEHANTIPARAPIALTRPTAFIRVEVHTKAFASQRKCGPLWPVDANSERAFKLSNGLTFTGGASDPMGGEACSATRNLPSGSSQGCDICASSHTKRLAFNRTRIWKHHA